MSSSVSWERLELPDEAALGALVGRLLDGGLRPGMQVALCGPLGAGKTTFVRYLCDRLGVADRVSSPSFVLEHRYAAASGLLPQLHVISHWDIYRLGAGPEELLDAVPDDELRLIEWADRDSELLARCDLRLVFELAATGPIEGGDEASSILRAVRIERE